MPMSNKITDMPPGKIKLYDELTVLINHAKESVRQAADLAEIEQLRVKFLGKKGQLTELLKGVSQISSQERPKFGKAVNIAKHDLQELLVLQESQLRTKALQEKLAAEKVDVTLAGKCEELGTYHPVTRVRDRLVQLFASMGFSVAEGPEIEDEHHNFDALNFTEHHPAKESVDTFYFPNGLLLRTHTSSVQIRMMEKQKPPMRLIFPGRVYRRDSDQTHTPMFHQLEGLVVDKQCTFADLKGLLQEFLNAFFETELTLRFRPSYFPFTEPSAEVDIQRTIRNKEDGQASSQTDWLEVLGCGMVHPNVLRNVNVDPDEYSGFAFGVGMDRLAMLRYGIPDLRLLFENDVRFLRQF